MNNLILDQLYSPLFRPDADEPRFTIITGGRASGKSYATALYAAYGLSQFNRRTLFTRWTLSSTDDSLVPEMSRHIEHLGLAADLDAKALSFQNPLMQSRVWIRGIRTSSGNQTAKLKSLTGVNCWLAEEAEELYDESEFDTIQLSIRDSGAPCRIVLVLNPTHDEHWICRRFFTEPGVDVDFNGVHDGVRYIHTTYLRNLRNLPPDYIRQAHRDRERRPAYYDNVWMGRWTAVVEGALWAKADLVQCREDDVPRLGRTIVAVDPNVSDKEGSCACGIVVCGTDHDGLIHIVSDHTTLQGPEQWVHDVGRAAARHHTNVVVCEQNQGGTLLRAVLQQNYPNLQVHFVNASKSKYARAAEAAAYYHRGMVRHAPGLDQLEAEQYTFNPKSKFSPDRLDAAVWGVLWLARVARPGQTAMRSGVVQQGSRYGAA